LEDQEEEEELMITSFIEKTERKKFILIELKSKIVPLVLKKDIKKLSKGRKFRSKSKSIDSFHPTNFFRKAGNSMKISFKDNLLQMKQNSKTIHFFGKVFI
jgi:hypothetical protein